MGDHEARPCCERWRNARRRHLGRADGEAKSKPERFTAEVSRRQARHLRRAASAAGLSLLVGGVFAAVDLWIAPGMPPVWPLFLAVGGVVAVTCALGAPRPLRSGGLKLDLVLLGGAVALGAMVEAGHVFGILDASAYHAALAGAVGIPASFLLTLDSRPFPVEAQVVRALRFSASILVVAAVGLFFALGLGAHGDEALALEPMIVLAVAGGALFHAGTRTPPLGWHRL